MSGTGMSTDLFVEHTLESAPTGSRRWMDATVRQLGRLAPPVARLANSPQVLEGFLRASALFEATTLEPIAREVLIMTVATRNGCHVCIAMHAARLEQLGASSELISRLRQSLPLEDERLEGVRIFTLAVLASAGDVGDEVMQDFLARGFTVANALEVVLGIGTYTISTFANRMTGAGLA